jgi:hypothetical protein
MFLFGFYYITGHSIDKENQLMLANERVSPPISERLRELSNNLKLLCYSTSSHVKLLEENETSSFGQSTEIVEPKTPIMEQTMRVNDRCEVADVNSPWETLSTRSFGMKVRSSNIFSNTLHMHLTFTFNLIYYFVVAEFPCSRIS